MLSIFDGLRDITLASVAFRLILSTLCGGIVGMEREFKRRSAGFRTHILICLGAAMTTLTSEFWLVYMRYYLDAARLGAGVVAGMGFIGAGTIIVTRRQRVKGLTTAAGLWTVAVVGLAIGAGTDIAIDAADVVLMKSRLSDVPAAIRLSRATLRNIHENLFWAFFYNVIGIPLAAGIWYPIFGWKLNPMFGAAAMSL